MNASYNPLRYIPDQDVRNAVVLGLICMWCVIFAVWTEAIVFLGASIFFHSLLLFGVLVTVDTFELASNEAKIAIKSPS